MATKRTPASPRAEAAGGAGAPLAVAYRPVKELQPHPRNVRLHDKANIEAIMESLATYGQMKPLVYWRGVIIAGCGTLQAATALSQGRYSGKRKVNPRDWDRVATVDVSRLSEDEAEAYSIADNKTTDMSQFDWGALQNTLQRLSGGSSGAALLPATGFRSHELAPLLQSGFDPGAPTEGGLDRDDGRRGTGTGSRNSVEFVPMDDALLQQLLERTGEDELRRALLVAVRAFLGEAPTKKSPPAKKTVTS